VEIEIIQGSEATYRTNIITVKKAIAKGLPDSERPTSYPKPDIYAAILKDSNREVGK